MLVSSTCQISCQTHIYSFQLFSQPTNQPTNQPTDQRNHIWNQLTKQPISSVSDKITSKIGRDRQVTPSQDLGPCCPQKGGCLSDHLRFSIWQLCLYISSTTHHLQRCFIILKKSTWSKSHVIIPTSQLFNKCIWQVKPISIDSYLVPGPGICWSNPN